MLKHHNVNYVKKKKFILTAYIYDTTQAFSQSFAFAKILVYIVVHAEVYLLYPVTKSNGNPYAFYCAPCKKSVSCAHQGLSDLTAHCSGKIHKSFERAIKTTQNMSSLMSFGTEADTNLAGKTIRAEVMHTNFIHKIFNISFLTAEHLSPLYAQIFPYSAIAKSFK